MGTAAGTVVEIHAEQRRARLRTWLRARFQLFDVDSAAVQEIGDAVHQARLVHRVRLEPERHADRGRPLVLLRFWCSQKVRVDPSSSASVSSLACTGSIAFSGTSASRMTSCPRITQLI